MDAPKYERLKQIIKNNIRDGVWRPGDKMPVEAVLCEHFIPVLAFKFTEKPRFAVDESKINALEKQRTKERNSI